MTLSLNSHCATRLLCSTINIFLIYEYAVHTHILSNILYLFLLAHLRVQIFMRDWAVRNLGFLVCIMQMWSFFLHIWKVNRQADLIRSFSRLFNNSLWSPLPHSQNSLIHSSTSYRKTSEFSPKAVACRERIGIQTQAQCSQDSSLIAKKTMQFERLDIYFFSALLIHSSFFVNYSYFLF